MSNMVPRADMAPVRDIVQPNRRMTMLSTLSTTGKPMTRHSQAILLIKWTSFAYGGASYTIYFFLGNPDNPEEEGATCIGSVSHFGSSVRSQEGSCDNCQQQKASGTLSRALVPITGPVLNRVQSTLNTDTGSPSFIQVKDCLKDLLEWRVVVGVSPDIEDLFLGKSIRSFANVSSRPG